MPAAAVAKPIELSSNSLRHGVDARGPGVFVMRNRIAVASAAFATLLLTAGSALAGAVVVTPTPEPVSLSLLAVGVGGLALLRRFRGK
jgi:hypothetical protein